MPSKARIAVIGTGWWATYTHIPGLLEHPAAQLAAICDTDAGKLAAAAEAFGVERTYGDAGEMLAREQLDGVVIATNHASHHALTRLCLEHGLHVMLEKPMTLHARDARELLALAQQHGRALIIGYPLNYAPYVLRAREIIGSGVLGAIQLICCAYGTRVIHFLRGDESGQDSAHFPVHGPGAVYSRPELSGGGQGHLQVTHAGGLLFWVTGLAPLTVQARMQRHGLPVDLVDALLIEFEGGALGTLGSTGNTFIGTHTLDIFCERGSLALDMSAATLTVRGALEEQLSSGSESGYQRFAPLYDLVDVCLGNSRGASADAGWRTVELLDAAYRSAEQGGIAVAVSDLYTEPEKSANERE